MLRKIRISVALTVFVLINLFFLNITGWMPQWFGWLEKIQFVPAVLALNFIIVAFWIVITLLFGRIYCSAICPMGVFQDIVAWFSKIDRKNKNKYTYSPAKMVLRYVMFALFVICMVAGFAVIPALIEPYGAYGRIVSNLFAPIYDLGNNLLAAISYKMGGYGFMPVEVLVRNMAAIGVALLTFLAIGFMAWRWGRTYCNTICPVGTLLGLLSKFSLYKIRIDESKCKHCLLCGKRCKASCIDSKNVAIDYSRCVGCFDCVDNCEFGAIHYSLRKADSSVAQKSVPPKSDSTNMQEIDTSRRQFITTAVTVAVVAPMISMKAQAASAIAAVEGNVEPQRTPIVPAGAVGVKHFSHHCVSCHLCVMRCPNNVLKPALNEYGIEGFMQPVMSYRYGFCRPQCTTCSEVCPAGAILKITPEAKEHIQIGGAVYLKENCLFTEDKICGNCVRRCPHNALSIVNGTDGKRAISVDSSLCVGCGACEFYCPAAPFKAIYVKGYENHSNINE